MRSNALHFLVESDVRSSRSAIKADLLGKIHYDNPAVFRRLRVDQVDNNFVATCAASFKAANKADIDLLTEVAAEASNKDVEMLEKEESNDRVSDPNKVEKSGNHGSAEEKKMYKPLVRVFDYIANFDQATARSAPRRYQNTNTMFKPEEPHTFGFPSYSPDIMISAHGVDASKSRLWRHRDAFGEVKPSNKQRPKPAKEGTIPIIVTQCADYARLFMSARPFMLFCVGILIFGTEFCVGIFDRDGITFSPAYDMFNDTEVFIRVVRSIACNLSIEELGSDPTVRVLSDVETEQLTGTKAWVYPSAVIASGGNDPRLWCTIGPPIWTSLSFLGRGTNVWRVRQYVEVVNQQPFLQGNEMILKTAWRSSARTPESDIYVSINQPPAGLAKFECGGDVTFAGYPITVQNLRSHPDYDFLPEGDIDTPTPVLHRLILGTIGRPLWEYTSDRDLLAGFRDALQAHKDLCDRGILHRDISAGNVLLATTQKPSPRGFITDVEFARLESPTITKPQVTVTKTVEPQNRYNDRGRIISTTEVMTRTHTRFTSTVTVKRGAGMTGTVQFMAYEILMGARHGPGRVTHEAKHDVESFIWVLSYCVMRSLFRCASHRSAPQDARNQVAALKKIFRTTFSQTTAKDISYFRSNTSPAVRFPIDGDIQAIITNFMSKPLVALFKRFQFLLQRADLVFGPTPLTHDAVLAVVDDTIASLP